MKPRLTRAVYPQPPGRGTGHVRGVALVSPARLAAMVRWPSL